MSASRRISIIIAGLALVTVGCADDVEQSSSTPPTTLPSTTTAETSPTSTGGPEIAGSTAPSTKPTPQAAVVEASVTGVVIDVVGGLTGIDSFKLRLPDGTDLELMPGDDLLFDDVAPISHLRDHLVSGAPVTATYLEAGEGLPIVVAISDATGGDHHDD